MHCLYCMPVCLCPTACCSPHQRAGTQTQARNVWRHVSVLLYLQGRGMLPLLSEQEFRWQGGHVLGTALKGIETNALHLYPVVTLRIPNCTMLSLFQFPLILAKYFCEICLIINSILFSVLQDHVPCLHPNILHAILFSFSLSIYLSVLALYYYNITKPT